jgi:hypothetical protein
MLKPIYILSILLISCGPLERLGGEDGQDKTPQGSTLPDVADHSKRSPDEASPGPTRGEHGKSMDGGGSGGQSKEKEFPAGVLTAGSFDDSLNLKVFEEFWNKSNHQKLGELTWQDRVKSFEAEKHDKLDISFVVDVTGSMGDELDYLKTEVKAIAKRISQDFDSISQRYSVVVYRDEGDDFVTRSLDFTESIPKVQNFLDQYSAAGGGDFPEAVQAAFLDANKLQWRSDDSTAKFIFWLADAPPHDQDMIAAVKEAGNLGDKGVAIYPIASSGVDQDAELLMRYAALSTGGQYLFLTDDSGIGGTHKEPDVLCYHVQKLDQLIFYKVKEQLMGERIDPSPEEIVRTVGKPRLGVCQQ